MPITKTEIQEAFFETGIVSDKFIELTWAVFNEDIDLIEKLLQDKDYQEALKEIEFYEIHPVNVALANGNLAVAELLLKQSVDFNKISFPIILKNDIETIQALIKLIDKYYGPETVGTLVNREEFKNVLLRQDRADVLEYLAPFYKPSYAMPDGTTMLYHAKPSGDSYTYLTKIGIEYNHHDKFLIGIKNVTETKDIELLNELVLDEKNLAYVTRYHFTGIYFAFHDSTPAEQALTELTSQFSPFDFIYLSERVTDKLKSLPGLKQLDHANFLYQLLVNAFNVKDFKQFCLNHIKQNNSKFFSHALGLSGKINNYLDLEGSQFSDTSIFLSYFLESYLENNEGHSTIAKYLQQFVNAFKDTLTMGYYPNLPFKVEKAKDNLEAGKLLLISGQSKSHLFGLSLIKKEEEHYFVCVTNRGRGTRYSGSQIFAIDEKQAHSIIEKFANPGIYTGIFAKTQIENNDILYNIIGQNNKPIMELPANPQKFGTCAFVNPKRFLETGLSLLALRDDNQELQRSVQKLYRQYSLFTRQLAIDMLCNYLEENKDNKDLQAIATTYILLQHDQTKDNGIEATNGKRLLEYLPTEMQNTLKKIYDSDNKIPLKVADLNQSHLAISLARLCDLSNVSKNITSIEIDGNQAIINVIPNREIKTGIRQKFEKPLVGPNSSEEVKLEVENISGQYCFKINNISQNLLDDYISVLENPSQPTQSHNLVI